jgi:hypothetical protein
VPVAGRVRALELSSACVHGARQAVIINLRLRTRAAWVMMVDQHVCELQLVLSQVCVHTLYIIDVCICIHA